MTLPVDDLKRQLQQLQSLVDSGVLSPETGATARAELERRWVAAVLAAPGASAEPAAPGALPPSGTVPDAARPSPRLLLGLGAGVLLLALAGYAWRGQWAGWAVGPGRPAAADSAEADAAPSGNAHAMNSGQIEAMVAALAKRLEATPGDAEGWLMLGRSYAVLGRHAEAVTAYRKALALRPQDAQTLADLADALAVGQQGRFDGEPTQLIQAALKADAHNVKALALAGTVAFERQDYAGAARHWEQVVQWGQPDSRLVAQMRDNLAEARQRAGLPPLPQEAPVAQAADAGLPATPARSGATAAQGQVSGRVELAPALAAQAAPDDVVFIYARPAQGSRMPLAILKKRVRDLPLAFTLDDSLAMSPAARLSGVAEVVVGARVSKSGQAMPQPGDLQGQVERPVATGATGLRILIQDVVR